MSKRETAVVVRFKGQHWITEEYVMKQWQSLLKGFDGQPTVVRDGEDFEMRASFIPGEEAGGLAAHLTNLIGIVATLEILPNVN